MYFNYNGKTYYDFNIPYPYILYLIFNVYILCWFLLNLWLVRVIYYIIKGFEFDKQKA